jgi:hypothetical protein
VLEHAEKKHCSVQKNVIQCTLPIKSHVKTKKKHHHYQEENVEM